MNTPTTLDRLRSYLQSIALQAVQAQAELDNLVPGTDESGDPLLELLSDIEDDVAKAKDALADVLFPTPHDRAGLADAIDAVNASTERSQK